MVEKSEIILWFQNQELSYDFKIKNTYIIKYGPCDTTQLNTKPLQQCSKIEKHCNNICLNISILSKLDIEILGFNSDYYILK